MPSASATKRKMALIIRIIVAITLHIFFSVSQVIISQSFKSFTYRLDHLAGDDLVESLLDVGLEVAIDILVVDGGIALLAAAVRSFLHVEETDV